MNNCSLVGRCTRDAELRYTNSGTAVLNFTLAVDGYKKDEVDFIDHAMFGERAEKIASWVTKGRLIGTTGRLNIRPYEGSDGSKRKAAAIVVNDVQFLDKGKAKDDAADLGREVPEDEVPF